MAYDYIKQYYGLSFTPGERVWHTVERKNGTVRPERPSHGHYVNVQFDGERHGPSLCHPNELVKRSEAR